MASPPSHLIQHQLLHVLSSFQSSLPFLPSFLGRLLAFDKYIISNVTQPACLSWQPPIHLLYYSWSSVHKTQNTFNAVSFKSFDTFSLLLGHTASSCPWPVTLTLSCSILLSLYFSHTKFFQFFQCTVFLFVAQGLCICCFFCLHCSLLLFAYLTIFKLTNHNVIIDSSSKSSIPDLSSQHSFSQHVIFSFITVTVACIYTSVLSIK